MESIFHEKQEGSLCAQHCLNALLQGAYFTPVELASLAERMDDEERLRMAESGLDSEEYRRFMEQPSGNMDDSGYFSVQVISSALEVWGLELVPFNSSDPLSKQANEHPENMIAYICNYRDHWLTIRKLGYQWFNLNSLLSKPELISNTYLTIFLAQLQQEGYSIFIVTGSLPDCQADDLLKLTPAVPVAKTPQRKDQKNRQDYELEKAIKLSLGEPVDKDEEDLQAAIQLSLQEKDPTLDRAIQMSLQHDPHCEPGPSKKEATNIPPENSQSNWSDDDYEEQEKVRQAVRLSLQADEPAQRPRIVNIPIKIEGREPHEEPSPANRPMIAPGTIDSAEVRRRRLAYLERNAATGR